MLITVDYEIGHYWPMEMNDNQRDPVYFVRRNTDRGGVRVDDYETKNRGEIVQHFENLTGVAVDPRASFVF